VRHGPKPTRWGRRGAGAAAQRAQAERDAALLTDRGRKALEQAARDVVLTVGDAVTRRSQGMVAPR